MPRRNALVTVVVVWFVVSSGCLTLNPSATANTSESAVFESVSVSESWASQRVRVNVRLSNSPQAKNVDRISVVTKSGTVSSVVNLDPGQTSVVLELPANGNVTLVASDSTNGTTVGKLNVSTAGDTII